MSTQIADPEAKLQAIAAGDMSVVDALGRMYEGNFEASGLDAQTYQLVRIAALAAMDAAPVSWLANLHLAREVGIPPDRVLGTLIALGPMIGSARTVAASAHIAKAIGLAVAAVEQIEQAEANGETAEP